MKKYIIFTADIHPIGGMQMLVAGKAKYLEKNNWQVFTFFAGSSHGKSEISSLTKYISGCGFKELWKRPYKFSDQDRNKVLDKMIDILRIDPTIDNEIIIESHYDIGAYWGELLAEKIHARHFFFTCNEIYRDEGKFYFENLDFFYFKYKRRELISEPDLFKKLFNGYRGLEENLLNLPAGVEFDHEQEPVQDVESSVIDHVSTQGGVMTVAYIGRTEKYYVPAIFDGVAEFAKNHPDKKIQFVIVGKLYYQERLNQLKKLFSGSTNVIVHGLGNLVPIPRKLFEKLDVVIAGARTCVYCAYENVPVIVANATGYKTAGCLYYDTNDAFFCDQIYSYAEMLEKVLINREYDNRKPSIPDRMPDDWHYEKILQSMKQSEPSLEYFTEKFKKDRRKFWTAIFPFEHVPKNSTVVLYGMNEISIDYQKQIGNYCKLVGIVADNYEDFDRTVMPPEKLTELDYDLIIIAEFPNQDRVKKIADNIFRVTGKQNLLYSWKFIDNT